MKRRLIIVLVFGSLVFLSSCAKNEECVCDNIDNITESDAKDVGVSLNEACDLAKIGDSSCIIE